MLRSAWPSCASNIRPNPASLRILALNPATRAASDVPTAAVGKRLDQDSPAIAQTAFPEASTAAICIFNARDRTALLERLRAQRSIREAAVTFRTYGGQVRHAVVALERFEAEGAEYILGIF